MAPVAATRECPPFAWRCCKQLVSPPLVSLCAAAPAGLWATSADGFVFGWMSEAVATAQLACALAISRSGKFVEEQNEIASPMLAALRRYAAPPWT
eukprot:3577438-Pleurochrysis_carterae.AAC.1